MTPQPDQLPLVQPFAVRPMAPADVPAVVAIDKLSFPTPWPASSYLFELLESANSHYRVLVRPLAHPPAHARPGRRWLRWVRDALDVPRSSDVTGYVGFRIFRREAHITTIAIHPDWRGRGLGEFLLLATIERAVRMGARRVTLEVRQSNQMAQHLYQKYGFHFTGSRKRYYHDGEDAMLMAAEVHGNGYHTHLHRLRVALNDRLTDERIRVGQEPGDGV